MADEVIFEGRASGFSYFWSLALAALALFVAPVLWAEKFAPRDVVAVFMVIVAIDLILFARAQLGIARRRYRITARRVQVEEGLLGKRVAAIDLWRVRDVVLNQTVVARVFGFGDLELVSSDEVQPDLVLRGLPGARALFDRVKDAVDRARRDGKVVALDARG